MSLGLYPRGFAIGFAIALALGPVGLLVIKRTPTLRWAFGLVSGLAVATADGLYAAIVAVGLTALTSLLGGAGPNPRPRGRRSPDRASGPRASIGADQRLARALGMAAWA